MEALFETKSLFPEVISKDRGTEFDGKNVVGESWGAQGGSAAENKEEEEKAWEDWKGSGTEDPIQEQELENDSVALRLRTDLRGRGIPEKPTVGEFLELVKETAKRPF